MKAIDLMYALRLEDGRRWGEAATEHQRGDAESVFSPERPHLHFITRPRSGSKTTDIAGFTVSWLATEAPRMSRGRVVAASAEQASILIDAAAAFIDRTPELAGVLEVENARIVNPTTGAWVRVLSQSDSGSWGLRNVHLLVCDEFCQWGETKGAKRVWSAIRSTVPKVAGCRLVVLSSAGEPSHWSHGVYLQAKNDPLWRVSEMPGPVPWLDADDLASLKRELQPSEYDRLVLNIWTESEERAISEEDYDAAAWACQRSGSAPAGLKGGGFRTFGPREGQSYVVTVDIGTVKDATVICVAHRETGDDGGGIVVDHLERWQGSKKNRVVIDQVRRRVAELSGEYNRAKVYADPDQFVDSLQQLNRMGVRAEEFAFTSTSVGQVATALVQAFRSRQIVVPDNPALREELLQVRLRETSGAVARLEHDPTGHDDQAVTIGMACHLLLAKQFTAADAFMSMMRKQIAERQQSPSEARDARNLRQFQRFLDRRATGPQRRREAQQRACQHRWRVQSDGSRVCVMPGCGLVEGAT